MKYMLQIKDMWKMKDVRKLVIIGIIVMTIFIIVKYYIQY
jgi:hypothetical protein